MKSIALLVSIYLLVSCEDNRHEETHSSPNGSYTVNVRIGNRNDPSDTSILMFELIDKNGKELDYFRTGASDVMKWIVSWQDDSTVVMYSADIGLFALSVSENKKLIPATLNRDMSLTVDKVYKQKYNQQRRPTLQEEEWN